VHIYVHEPGIDVLPIGAPLADVLRDLLLRFKAWLRSRGMQCSCKRFTLSTIHRDKASSICLYQCKAAQSPTLIAWLAELLQVYTQNCPQQYSVEANLVSVCVWGLHSYFEILKAADRFFTHAEVSSVHRAGIACLTAYSELAKLRGGAALWHHIPKMHQFQHLLEDAVIDLSNPRFFHCFSDEDFVGRMLRLSRRGHALKVIDHVVECSIIGAKQRFDAC
jgi:hypothetical protein